MTVAAESYEAKALENVITMLAKSATFQALVGAANETEAKASIIETHGGNLGEANTAKAVDGSDIDLVVDNFAAVGFETGLDVSAGAVGYSDYDFAIGVRIVRNRVMPGKTPAEVTRTAWNDTGKIRAEMQANVGADGCLADADISSAGLFMDEEEGVNRDRIITQLTATARG